MSGKIRAFKSSSGAVWVGDDDIFVLYFPPERAKVVRDSLHKNAQAFDDRTNTGPKGHTETTPAEALKWWDKCRRTKGGAKLLPARS